MDLLARPQRTVPPHGPAPTSPTRWRPPTALVVLAAVAAFVGLVALFEAASVHSFAGNSDGATVVLEGQAMAHGNPLLHGWSISLDSFWSVDALFYALGVGLVGLHPVLWHLVPAVIAACTVAVGALVARGGHRGGAGFAGAATVLLLLALPSNDLSYFLLQGPWHVGTALWCLVAFAGISRGRLGWTWALGVVALAAGLLGDFVTLTIGILPMAAAGVLAAVRRRHWQDVLLPVGAAVASCLLALVVRFLAGAIGTFAIANRNLPVQAAQIRINLEHLPQRAAGLFGFGVIPVGVGAGPRWIQAVHLLAGLLVLGAFLLTAWRVLRDLVRGRPDASRPGPSLDELLLLATGADLATFVIFSPTGNGNYARYLIPGAIFAAVLTGRVVADSAQHIRAPALRRGLLVAACALGAIFAAGTGELMASTAPVQETGALADFLLAHHLIAGVGDYWSASATTVESGGAVVVRPVTNDRAGHLLRYERQSDGGWYKGKDFSFLVFDTGRKWRQVDEKVALRAFGPPAHTFSVGSYRVLTWDHPLHFSPDLGPQPSPLHLFWSAPLRPQGGAT